MQLKDVKVLIDERKYSEAIPVLHKFESQFHDDKIVMSIVNIDLAECYKKIVNLYEAERYYLKVLETDDQIQNVAKSYSALASIYCELARDDESKNMLLKLRDLLPSISDELDFKLSMIDLIRGDFKKGFEGYEGRFSHEPLKTLFDQQNFQRLTDINDIKGKSILLKQEQGFGDIIQFARYAETFKKLGASKVGLLGKQPVKRLMENVVGLDEVIFDVNETTKYDYEIMMMSCPYVLGTEHENQIPNDNYIKVKPKDSKVWKEKLKNFKKFRVGIVWSGSDRKGLPDMERIDSRRSIPLELFRPLLDADCDFFSLQKGGRQDDLKTFYGVKKINDFMDDVNDFYDTACLIDNLDLVISVDTSTAHVAGAMGKPVWIFSRLDGCWRWLEHRSDTPWYPSMKIYRQKEFKEWRPVMLDVLKDLKSLLDK